MAGMSAVSATSSSPLASGSVFGAAHGRNVALASAADAQARLARAKERIYVLCQLGGWGFLLALQSVYYFWIAPKQGISSETRWFDISVLVMVIAMGLLLTHFGRNYISRHGWKEMGWRTLLPRIFAISAIQSCLWSLLGYAWPYVVLGYAWTSKISLPVVMCISIMNGIIMLIGWHSLYFFYHVFERLNRLQVEQLRLAASVKEAELRALKSQVNPHFLFNSLNSLRALIDEDAPRARESVTRLSNMLRYSLSSGQQETVLLEDELRVVEDYLALEQIRHENRLQVRWDIAPEARRQPVPPMLLQTLVENAVKYGISTRRGGGEVVVSAAVEHDALRLRVTNPGDLGAPASSASARAGSSTGVGLRNASERLKLLFGDRAMLRLLAEPADCVTADVHIPLAKPAP